jgi:hypothetical protein
MALASFLAYVLNVDKIVLWCVATARRAVNAIPRLFTPIKFLLLTPLLMLALAVQIELHGGGKPHHFGPMVGDQGQEIHLWMRPVTVDPDNWITSLENQPIDEFNRRHGVLVAAR